MPKHCGAADSRTSIKVKHMTAQLEEFLTHELYPWQKQVLHDCSIPDSKTINLIYDPNGNSGKSIFCEYMEYKDLACEIEPVNGLRGLMAQVMDQGVWPAYIVDLPRAMKKDKLGGFYSGIETLKNGVAYDRRYKFRQVRFDRPVIWVFTDILPAFDLLSTDRWRVWKMQEDMSLTIFKP